jgi:hypothetical protein
MASAPIAATNKLSYRLVNVSTAYLLNIFFGPVSTLQRFNDSTVHVTEA